jgi:hypothetical protein
VHEEKWETHRGLASKRAPFSKRRNRCRNRNPTCAGKFGCRGSEALHVRVARGSVEAKTCGDAAPHRIAIEKRNAASPFIPEKLGECRSDRGLPRP